jgi:neutral ceramidase
MKILHWCVAVALVTHAAASSNAHAAGPLRVGAAAEMITPPVGTPLAGYYEHRESTTVHDDLFAKAIVIERDGVKAALVVCDLITLPRNVIDEARRLIAESPGIPADRVMISATHTHTGPIVRGPSGEDPLKGDNVDKTVSFGNTLPQRIAQAVKNADARLAPATAAAAIGREEHVSFNRRFFMKDGTVGWNPMKRSPKVDRPAGPIDPDVPVVYFESLDGNKPIATHVSFAMHLDTVAGEEISADYPATIASILGKVKGPDMVTVFATGACGDLNHLDNSSTEKQRGHDEAARIGTVLAGEVVKTYTRLKPVADGPVRAKRQPVSLPLVELQPGDFEKARDFVLNPGKSKKTFLGPVWAYKVLDVAARKGAPLDVEVQVIALGDELAWVSLPGEVFTELGLEIKKRSPFKTTIIVELANGSIGYIPTKRAFAEGNYEPTTARCAAGSGETLVETAVSLLNELHPQP